MGWIQTWQQPWGSQALAEGAEDHTAQDWSFAVTTSL